MHVLIVGATGLIGASLRLSLLADGHKVTGVARRVPQQVDERGHWIALDLEGALTPEAWLPHLDQVDAVVNAAGVFSEGAGQHFSAVHALAPRALFDACVRTRVSRVVQVSALGAAPDAPTEFLRSKHAADDHLLRQPLNAVVVQPSLVFSMHGRSSELFMQLAALPWIPLPGGGHQSVQPIHLDDLLQLLRALLTSHAGPRVEAVGARALALRDYLLALRAGLGLPPTSVLAVPKSLAYAAAHVASLSPNSVMDPDSLRMLEAGSVADVKPIASVLGHMPRDPVEFIAPNERHVARTSALTMAVLPLLRVSLATVWIATGIVSLGLYPVADSKALLSQAGVPASLQSPALYGAALLDLLLGILTLTTPRRWLWRIQAALMLFYMVIIALRLPEYWLHPYGPLIKNFPILALLALLDLLTPRREPPWNT